MKNLTNYDKYVLARKNSDRTNSDKNANNGSIDNDYENYLINELRRTTPSRNKVMREEEFYEMKRGNGGVTVAYAPEKEEKNSRFKLRKGGKIILIVYVILMIALASILIVSNTTAKSNMFDGISFNQSAGAASSDDNAADGTTVKAMTVEDEKSEETNWFDKLCDSLNK